MAGLAPQVSVLMACRNGGRTIDDAILSVRRQTMAELELVVVDDRSADDTAARVAAHAAADGRVKLVPGAGTGIAAARNLTLSQATGRWVAIVDSDDLVHPRHLEHLLAAAQRTGAEVTACDMVAFQQAGAGFATHRFADRPAWAAERFVDLATYVRVNALFGSDVALGYLKPLVDTDILRRHAIGYDPRLNIGEDYDFVSRILAAGGRMLFLPGATYFYRRAAGSTSHRMKQADVLGLLAASDVVVGPQTPPAVLDAVVARRATLHASLALLHAVDALKARRPVQALRIAIRTPGATRLLLRSVREGVGKRLARVAPAKGAVPAAVGPVALVIGEAEPGGPVHRAAAELAADGYRVVARPVPTPAESFGFASALSTPGIILAADSEAVEAAPYALAPRALLVAPPGVDGPGIGLHLPAGPVPPGELRAAITAALARQALP